MKPKLSIAQKVLLAAFYGLIVLMIVFSFQAKQNLGQEGYDKCVQKKCEERGDAFCSKFREINNCCLGADGAIAVSGSNYICVFE